MIESRRYVDGVRWEIIVQLFEYYLLAAELPANALLCFALLCFSICGKSAVIIQVFVDQSHFPKRRTFHAVIGRVQTTYDNILYGLYTIIIGFN